jgi:hypothetical protein
LLAAAPCCNLDPARAAPCIPNRPAISALEHQQYDVILLTCEDPKKAEPKAEAEKKPEDKKTEIKNDKNKTPSKKN